MENIDSQHISQHRPKTKSKNFYDDEIIGVWPDGTIYLKEGVRRLKYNPLEEMIEEAYTEFKIKIQEWIEKRNKLSDYEKDFN